MILIGKGNVPDEERVLLLVYINLHCLLHDVILNSVSGLNRALKFCGTHKRRNCLLELKQVSPNISEWWSAILLLWASTRSEEQGRGEAVNCCRIRMLISRTDIAALVHVSTSHVITTTAYSSQLQPACRSRVRDQVLPQRLCIAAVHIGKSMEYIS